MAKTLYYSDMDGTLLQPDGHLSDFTRDALNRLYDRGVAIGVATARTAATVVPLLAGVRMAAPAILMNGVCTYDLTEKRYREVHPIPKDALAVLLDAVHSLGCAGYLYTVGDALCTWYEKEGSENGRVFRESRQREFGKKFVRVQRFEEADAPAVYFSVTDTAEKLLQLKAAVERIPGVQPIWYRDVYGENCYFLEVSAAGISKAKAASAVRQSGGYTGMVAFGDNLNDLPLFAVSDESCAVENAVPECRAAATRTVGANTADGVARWLLAKYLL